MSVRRGSGLLVPAVLVLIGFVTLLGLGTWQIERKAWKEALIATLDRRLSDTPVSLPPPDQWAGMTADNSEFTRVRLHVDFPASNAALVYTGGSSIRDDVKAPGYFVFSPARLAAGGQIVVDRGYVPTRTYPANAGPQDIVGYLRWPEAPSWFVAAHDAKGEIWTVREPHAMAQVRGWGPVAPFYIDQEAPVPPGGLPHPATLQVNLRNEHLQYAITWYGLAAVLAGMSALWALNWRRRHKTAT